MAASGKRQSLAPCTVFSRGEFVGRHDFEVKKFGCQCRKIWKSVLENASRIMQKII